MSYEGYNEYLCSNGHYYTVDSMEVIYGEYDGKCYHCKSSSVWSNQVDQTNDNGFPYSVGRLREKTPAEYDECPTCEHKKLKQPPTYYVPSKEETKMYEKDLDRYYKELYDG